MYSLKKQTDYEIRALEGGQKDNAITREAAAELLVSADDVDAAKAFAADIQKKLREEYAGSDENITVTITEKRPCKRACASSHQPRKGSVLSGKCSVRYPKNERNH